jgi:hypothetical protein
MCKKSGESIDNLLLHCEVARDLWSLVCDMFGVDGVMPTRLRELLMSLGGQVRRCDILEV